jgi:site-specific DNA-methyltransferase (adenine-specific)
VRAETIGNATLYLGDCREILPAVPKVDAVVTDPPYPGYDYGWPIPPLESLGLEYCRGFYFWPAMTPFPMAYTAMHIWSKANVNIGDRERYEVIYEVNGNKGCGVYRASAVNCKMNATLNGDKFYGHPTQKPIRLLNRIVRQVKGIVLDPFMGTGTTGVACINVGRPFIGIELDPKFYEIALERITAATSQQRLFA